MRNLGFSTLLVALVLVSTQSTEAGKKKGIKGRYIEVESGVSLSDYRGALVVLDTAQIVSDKDRPVDTEAVRKTSEDMLRDRLEGLGLFAEILSTTPLDLPDEKPVLKLTTNLTLQHGSQVKRVFIGAGAGKSKLHIRIDFLDLRSGKKLAFFNGYGTGAGLFSISGGGIQRMARDDFDENYRKLGELLVEHMR